jgi:hypothetical protein
LDPEARDEDEMAFVRAIADARTLVGDALETARWRLEETKREQAVRREHKAWASKMNRYGFPQAYTGV